MSQIVTLEVSGGGFDGAPFSVAQVTLDDTIVKRILQLAAEVVRLDVYRIELFDHRVQPMIENDDGELVADDSVRLDCVSLSVCSDRVYWSGYAKHGDDHTWETDAIDTKDMHIYKEQE